MRFRADIEALRGIAVLLVVLFHVGYEHLAGGYVGVDVFFVISGFLITAQIVAEIESTGRVRLARFWGRRLRRLVPLLAVTIVLTSVLALLAYSPLAWRQISRDGLASLTYTSNISFARDATFYFQQATSPFLHTWSLSVEEQFYIVWPLIIVVTTSVGRQFIRRSPKQVLAASVAAVSLVSFVLGVALTNRGTPWAFYSSPTRAWEFGAGALAMLVSQRSQLKGSIGDAAVAVGLGCIVGSALVFDALTPFPGIAAAVPVFGTALVILGGAAATRTRRILEAHALRYLGRVSYAWYLFHWPAIVLTAAYFGTQRRSVWLAAALASLALAHVATTRIELPFRESTLLRSARSSWTAVAVVVVALSTSLLVWEQRADSLTSSGYLAELAEVRSARTESGSGQCVDRAFDGVTVCVYGHSNATRVVVLVGDSHAGQWTPAFERMAADGRFALVVRSRGGCPATDIAVARTGDDEVSGPCLAFRDETKALISAIEPSLIVVANADYTSRTLGPGGELLSGADALSAAGLAAHRFASEVVAPSGANLLVIENNPGQRRDPIECLARFRSSAKCSISSDEALGPVERLSAAEVGGFESVVAPTVFRVAPLICNEARCEVEIDGTVTYADGDHLSLPFVLKHQNALEEAVMSALATS